MTDQLPEPKKRRIQDLLLWTIWLTAIIAFAAVPVSIHIRFGGESDRNKDYDTWYMTGERVLAGEEIYPLDELPRFNFMYPPAAASMIAPLTAAGRLPFILFLEAINAICWIFCVYACVYLVTGSAWNRPALLYLVPTLATAAYVYDTFQLGQPNLILLAMLLGAFMCLRTGRPSAAGGLVALATAVKAFPVMLLVYFLWRRQSRAVTGFFVTLAVLLLLLPAPFRGFNRNVADLGTWANGMLFSYDQGTIAQRPGQSYRWKNASLIATSHRLLRSVPADRIAFMNPPPRIPNEPNAGYEMMYANVADLDFQSVNFFILSVALLICLGFVILMPPETGRTLLTDALEYSMLLVMVLVFSPISWFYYGVWLMLPFTAVVRFLHDRSYSSRQRNAALAGLVVCLVLFNFVPPWEWYRSVRAIGTSFFGYMIMLVMLGWFLHLERQRADSSVAKLSDSTADVEFTQKPSLPQAA